MPTVRRFVFTGATHTFRVPAGVTSVQIDAFGGSGGVGATATASQVAASPGLGAITRQQVSVVPFEQLTVRVAGRGRDGSSMGAAGGFNGGGAGGASVQG